MILDEFEASGMSGMAFAAHVGTSRSSRAAAHILDVIEVALQRLILCFLPQIRNRK